MIFAWFRSISQTTRGVDARPPLGVDTPVTI
ncbi:hypothetical protein SAMN06295998_12521 [Primorskyibacter flagellatus]|uniref:Uncharacterized protein n=1 Tax=Primorskyibacter flagellatus TaxID=1387277 RepID=A0A1W2EAG9_9RHOB|nr:hypothetical protein SAMN06295998_12521 [Primorskyibacter flagellatus]